MAKLTTSKRKKLKPGTFGLPKERKYPMPDKSHAANAKARATQQVKKGNLTPAENKKIDAKANKILGKTSTKKRKKSDRKLFFYYKSYSKCFVFDYRLVFCSIFFQRHFYDLLGSKRRVLIK